MVKGPGRRRNYRVPETGQGIAVALMVTTGWSTLDPYRGGMLAVAEATRNLACGGPALGITDGLNFGNPERPRSTGSSGGLSRG